MKRLFIILSLILIGICGWAQNSDWDYKYRVPGSTDTLLIWHNDTTKVTTAGEFEILVPYGTYDMSDYARSEVGSNVLNYRNGTFDVTTSGVSYLYGKFDTISLDGWTPLPFVIESDYRILETADSINNIIIGKANTLKFVNDFDSRQHVMGTTSDIILWPGAGDTIKSDIFKSNYSQFQTYTTEADSWIEADEVFINESYGSFDEQSSFDSIVGHGFYLRDTGIDPDSVGKVFVIKNTDGDLRGSDATYFLYSEYGDNYLNGNIEALRYHYIYPSSDVDMGPYYEAGPNKYIYDYQEGTWDLSPSTASGNLQTYLRYVQDTINFNDNNNRIVGYSGEDIHINTTVDQTGAVGIGKTADITLNNFEAPDMKYTANRTIAQAYPLVSGDTVELEEYTGSFYSVQTYTPNVGSKVDIGKTSPLHLFHSYDSYVRIDSTIMLEIETSDDGIATDSLGKYYGIYHHTDAMDADVDTAYFLYSEWGDNYLNGDLEIVGKMNESYSGSIAMDDYYNGLHNSYKTSRYNLNIDLSNTALNVFDWNKDTVILGGTGTRPYYHIFNADLLNVESGTSPSFITYDYHAFEQNFAKLPTKNSKGYYFLHRLEPGVNDTIEFKQHIPFSISSSFYTPEATSRIAIDEEILLDIFSSYDDYSYVDSVKGINITMSNIGMPADSISLLHVIKNNDDGLRGKDGTYFLYSEYGDNYLNGNLFVGDTLETTSFSTLPYGYYDMEDYLEVPGAFPASIYSPYFRAGKAELDLSDTYQNRFLMQRDTFDIVGNGNKQLMLDDKSYILNNDFDNAPQLSVRNENLYLKNYKAIPTYAVTGKNLTINLYPDANDTLFTDRINGFTNSIISYTPDATSLIAPGYTQFQLIYGFFDDYVSSDSVTGLEFWLRDGGIPADSIDVLKIIKNTDDGSIRGADRTYFLYSEYGDFFLGGGGQIDQVGENIILGADTPDHLTRTDEAQKGGSLMIPHYDNDEEVWTTIGGNSTSTGNILFIGGGKVNYNAATQIRFSAAANNTTLSGSNIATMDTNGLQLTNGSELDQTGHSMLIGSDLLSEGDRTDATTKTGLVTFPHYTNSEESIEGVAVLSTSADNTLYLGGTNSSYNGATKIVFAVADNTTDTGGNLIGEVTTDGFEITSGRMKEPTISASLTDGAPTDAELDSAIGDTPAGVGAGASYIVIDTDGTSLVYRVISNGTNWFYEALTQAT